MLVSDFKDYYESSYGSGTLTLIPNYCTMCGSELEISDGHVHIFCPNVYCLDKLSRRAVDMLNMLSIKNIGESTARELIYYQDFNSPVEMLLYEEDDFSYDNDDEYLTPNKYNSLVGKMNHISNGLVGKREMTITKYIQLHNLPDLNTRAEILFGDCHSLEDLENFLNEIESYGMDVIQEKLGIKTEISTLAIKIYETLCIYHKEIIDILKVGVENNLIVIKEPIESDVTITLVCSDEVGGNFKTKKDLYDYIENNFKTKVNINWKSSAVKTMDALIWKGADGTSARYTSKVKKTENWNSNGAEIPIITGSQLVELLDKSSDGGVFLDTLKSL